MKVSSTSKSNLHPDNIARRSIKYTRAPKRTPKWKKKQIKLLKKLIVLQNLDGNIPPRANWKDCFDQNLCYEFQVLVGMLLSVQCTDEGVKKCMRVLIENNLMTVEALASANKGKLSKLLSTTFNKKKAKYIINCSKILIEKFDGKVPCDYKSLISLPGVGDKIAGCVLSEGFETDTAKNFDSHMTFLSSSYLQWANPNDKTAQEVAKRVRGWLDEKYWKYLNPVIAGLGQLFSRFKTKKKCHLLSMLFKDVYDIGGSEFLYLLQSIFVNCYDGKLESQVEPPTAGSVFVQDVEGRMVRRSLRIRATHINRALDASGEL